MKLIILLGFVLLPWPALADKDCRVIEFPDHVEAVCSGKTDSTPEHAEQASSNTSVTKGAQVSRKRQQLQDIRSLNAHRFDPEESQSTPNASGKTK